MSATNKRNIYHMTERTHVPRRPCSPCPLPIAGLLIRALFTLHVQNFAQHCFLHQFSCLNKLTAELWKAEEVQQKRWQNFQSSKTFLGDLNFWWWWCWLQNWWRLGRFLRNFCIRSFHSCNSCTCKVKVTVEQDGIFCFKPTLHWGVEIFIVDWRFGYLQDWSPLPFSKWVLWNWCLDRNNLTMFVFSLTLNHHLSAQSTRAVHHMKTKHEMLHLANSGDLYVSV